MENKGIERRECKRFKIEGATVNYKKPKFFSTPQKFREENCPVIELSRGGIRFLSQKFQKINSKIKLTLNVPEENSPLELNGRVIWKTLSPTQSYKYQIGVQFTPYGHKKGHNPLQLLEKIKELEEKYQSRK